MCGEERGRADGGSFDYQPRRRSWWKALSYHCILSVSFEACSENVVQGLLNPQTPRGEARAAKGDCTTYRGAQPPAGTVLQMCVLSHGAWSASGAGVSRGMRRNLGPAIGRRLVGETSGERRKHRWRGELAASEGVWDIARATCRPWSCLQA
jgi:hypothetical protein